MATTVSRPPGPWHPGPVPELVPAPDAPLGGPDPTRRWALALGGATVFPGIAPEEADRTWDALAAMTPHELALALVPVHLPVVLSDGAGPHLLDATGRLLLAVGEQGRLPGLHVVMGPDGAGAERIGVAGPGPGEGRGGLWRWRVWARVPPVQRLPALDALARAAGADDLRSWRDGWTESGGAG